MSVIVDINIADGSARRHLHIENITTEVEFGANGFRSLDQECSYTALISGGNQDRIATFTHRYGDDVTVLIAKAGEAIREKYGRL
ncbi:MAG: hypothetical protein K0Q52_162 [Microbacterium sp.]|nr:hypothetical protein [Microbacterium sp.]